MLFQIGDTVGDYEVVGLLGEGGMGRVYKVRHRILDRLDAMKVLLPDRQDDPQFGQRFEREIKVQASLHHPNIAALHTALWVDNRLLMIVEFVDGVTLYHKMLQGPLTVREGVEIICGVLDALAHAHAQGVVHRDVKPGNIMITGPAGGQPASGHPAGGQPASAYPASGQPASGHPASGPPGIVKLTDFGIARKADETITRAGMVVGSIYYMSPEQIKGGPVDGRSDLYAVGVTLYEALTGRRPIDGEGTHGVISAHLAQMPVPPTDFVPGFPAALSRILMKSLAKSPAERFQSAAEFRKALEPFLETALLPAASPPQTPAGIDPAILTRLEKCLAAVVGPIARLLVVQTARGVQDGAVLRSLLAGHIAEESQRQEFLRCCERQAGETTAARPPTRTSLTTLPLTQPGAPREWNPEFLEKAQRELARHIGPLARVIVAKASKKVQTPEQLIDLLSSEIPGAKQREEFASNLRRGLG